MADNSRFAQLQPFTLAGAGAILGATTLTLNSMLQIDESTPVTMDDFGAIGYGTLEPGNGTQEEQISFTGIVQNANGTATLTGLKNVTFVYPYTETSGLDISHPGGATFIISNNPGLYNKFANKENDEQIAGAWTFDVTTGRPKLSADVDTAVLTELVDFGQLSRQAIAGAANASTVAKGLVQLPTQAQVDAKTTTGSTGALLAITPDTQRSTLESDYVVDTGAANAYVITPSPAIVAYAAGQIFTWKAANTNTTTSTIAVNGLVAKTIKKGNGTVNLSAGDIVAGQIIYTQYDGTNFQMISQTAAGSVPSFSGADVNKFLTTADGTSLSFGQTVNIQSFTSAGTNPWTKPTNAQFVDVFIWGAGGGGGGGLGSTNQGSGGSGGGGGGYSYKRFLASALGATENVITGTAGTAGAANGNGGNGSASSFGTTTLLVANGGTGGVVGATSGAAGGAGGTAANGDIKEAGGAGGNGKGSSSGAITTGVDTATDHSGRGGGGGYDSEAVATNNGANGGAFITNYVKVGGSGGIGNGGAGNTSTAGLFYGGTGGAGGGETTQRQTTGFVGGAGAAPGGGGGGGSGGQTTGGVGGAGAVGAVVVITYF